MAKKKPAGPRIVRMDSSKLPARAAELSRHRREVERLRIEAYRIVMPNLPAEMIEAVRGGGQLSEVMARADRQWTEAMGEPALTPDNLESVMETVGEAGYSKTDAGLQAWTRAKNKPRREEPQSVDEEASLDERAAQSDNEAILTQAILSGGDSGQKIFQIAGSNESADLRMEKICDIDSAYVPWNSPEWGQLLRVRTSAIRKTHFWKIERPRRFEDARNRWKDTHPDDDLPEELRDLGK